MLEELLFPSARRDSNFIATDGNGGTLASLGGTLEGTSRNTIPISEHIGIFPADFAVKLRVVV
jgi:hypothetical protein